MARLRNYLLPALVIGVLAMWAGTIDSARLFDTWGLMSDVESDTNNTITADTLGAPTTLLATANGVTTIDLTWNASPDSYATGYRLFRRLDPGAYGAGTALTETQTNCVTPGDSNCAYSDTSLVGATKYCYQVRATYLNWTSPLTNESCATTATPVTLNDLFLNSPNVSTNTLVTSGASGDRTISANTNPPFEFIVWNSTSNVTVTGQVNWVLTLDLNTNTPFQSATITVDLWLTTNGCGDSSSGAGKTLLASAGATTLLADGSVTLAAAAISPPLTGKLCLKITNQGGNENSGASHAARILTAGVTKLRGPFDP